MDSVKAQKPPLYLFVDVEASCGEEEKGSNKSESGRAETFAVVFHL